MSNFNLGASEFRPSWLKAAPAAPSAEKTVAPKVESPKRSPQVNRSTTSAAAPSMIPWKAPATAAISTSSPSATSSNQNTRSALPRPSAAPPSSSNHQDPSVTRKNQQHQQVEDPQGQRHMNIHAASFTPGGGPVRPTTTTTTNTATNHTVSTGWLKTQPTANAPPVVTAKSDSEALAISRTSALKLSAAAFVPGQKLLRRLGAKPSPLALTPNEDEEMLLPDAWRLHHLEAVVRGEENFDPTLVFRIDSVATFWKTMNNMPDASFLPLGSSTFLFRDDINPRWEDPKNRNGGMWRFKVPAINIDDVWTFVCCRTIGESWDKAFRNTINGVVLKVREKGYWIEVWVTERHPGFPDDLHLCFQEVLPAFAIDFFEHQEMQKIMKEVAANSTKKAKAKKRW